MGDGIYGRHVEPRVKINKEFYETSIDPQILMANIQLMDRGVIGKSDLRELMRKSNLIEPDRTDEMLDEEVSSDDIFFDNTVEPIVNIDE